MIQTLKNQFFQVFSVTTLWVTLLFSLFSQQGTFGIAFVWRILAVALIAALLFGVVYTSLWTYLTLPASGNILISASLNILGGMTVIWLLSPEMFSRVWPWTPAMLVLSLIGHLLAFYFYAKRQNNRDVAGLNKLI